MCVHFFACVRKATRKYIRMVCVWLISLARALFLPRSRKERHDFRDTEKFCLAILSVSLRFEILGIKSGINLGCQEFYIIFSTHIGVCANTHTNFSLSLSLAVCSALSLALSFALSRPSLLSLSRPLALALALVHTHTLSLFLSLSLSHTHTHTHAHRDIHARTHTH